MDYATRYPEAIPPKGSTAKEIAGAPVSVSSRVSIPEEILTDQGRQFTANYMQELMEILKIRHIMSTPYHPMCNGLVESFNGTLKRMLFKLCNEHPTEWHKMIDLSIFAYREVPNESTGFSPFELRYGRHVRGAMQMLKELWTVNIQQEEVKSTYDYVTNLQEKLEATMKIAMDNLENAKGRYKSCYDRKTKPQLLKVGDPVLILQPNKQNLLQTQRAGPYVIIGKVYENNHRMKVNNKIRTYHANRIKKYNGTRSDH